MKLSVALATYNEENNIKACLDSIKDIADEIIIVDGTSTDKTVEIAKEFTTRILVTDNPAIFHINKQKAIDMCKYDWILQLDADERVTKELATEVKRVIVMGQQELESYQRKLDKRRLFLRHQRLLEQRDGKVGTEDGVYTAFFIPRLNFFLGKYLRFGGVYPDGVIRLIKKGKAYLPGKSVHEQFVVEGKVGWLQSDLLHVDSPTFIRYLQKNSRYIDLMVNEFKVQKLRKDPVRFLIYCLVKPIWWFGLTVFYHKGIFDGIEGIVFSFFSALRFPRAYLRYLSK